jgi:hypothetical protein
MRHAVFHPHPNRSAELTAEALPRQGGGDYKFIGQAPGGDFVERRKSIAGISKSQRFREIMHNLMWQKQERMLILEI